MQEMLVPSLCWEDPQEKGMATHSSILAWKIPWAEHACSHNIWASLVLVVKNPPARCKRHGFDLWAGKIPWRRAWQPIPVFLSGESPWKEEPGGVHSIGSQQVGHYRSNLAQLQCFIKIVMPSNSIKETWEYFGIAWDHYSNRCHSIVKQTLNSGIKFWFKPQKHPLNVSVNHLNFLSLSVFFCKLL